MNAAIDRVLTSDAVVIGTGVAGLSVALATGDLQVALYTKDRLGTGGASPMAQGGVAAAVAPDDSPEEHGADTLAAAAGLADPAAVRLLTTEGPGRIADLLRLGARFDRLEDGRLALGREAAHRRPRIVHARDATGAEIVRALVAAVAAKASVRVHEETATLDLVLERGRVVGVTALGPDGARILHLARAVVLATGGVGQVFSHTTNPIEATGDGLAMAARAGAELADLEFVQFHPTALAVGADPMPLLTEALRGRGALLIDDRGRRFMPDFHPDAELAPRDVVARAIWRMELDGRRVLLDARDAVGERLARDFPTAFENCSAHGLDAAREPVPVSPAAHYHMGGVAVDSTGRSSLAGLWACGEVARGGAHGANRLASNSLLEGLVYGHRVGRDLVRSALAQPAAKALVGLDRVAGVTRAVDEGEALRERLRGVMWSRVGLERDRRGLESALAELRDLAGETAAGGPETRNLLTVARLIATAAKARRESRGAHFRTDFPSALESWRRPLHLRQLGTGSNRVTVTGLPDEPAAKAVPGGAAT